MTISPQVTIGICCFNAQDTILRALQSAIHQDWPNLEIVVVDDCSTDQSVSMIQECISVQSVNVQLVQHKRNKGPAGSRNTILSQASGEFIAFFDDDDESLPQRIRVQVEALLQYEKSSEANLVACYSSGLRKYPNGYILELPAIGSQGETTPQGPMLAEYLLIYRRVPNWFYGSGIPTCSLFARAATFAAVNGFDENLRRAEDSDFAIRLSLMGGHFIGTAESLFVQYSTSAPDKSYEKNLAAEQLIARKHRAFLESINRYYYALHWSKLRYWHFKRQYGRFLAELLGLLLRYPLPIAKHILATGPKRLLHERRMAREVSP